MTHSKANDAVRGKTARACDFCIRKHACWFCAADDAFLCQACDSSIHSANPLASRHHRVCLKTASFRSVNNNINHNSFTPSWEKGFTKKPRTPRLGKQPYNKALNNKSPFDVVPEVVSDDTNSHEESVEQLLFRVPVCNTTSSSMASPEKVTNGLFLSSEIGLAKFDDDVENLLGKGVENESVGMEGLGMCSGNVKVEEKEVEMMMGSEEGFELFGFDCDDESQAMLSCGKVEDKINDREFKESDEAKRKKILLLQLDYEAVITAWASQKSHWTIVDKPDLVTHSCWPHCMGTCGMAFHQPYSEELGGLFGCHTAMVDGGREARVSRYREKRRRRLFSKKIRYEVRKLNAEKRPRMKGRFVKRVSLSYPLPLVDK